MKTHNNILPFFMFIWIFLSYSHTYCQNIDSSVTIELSIPHGDQLKKLNDCSSFNNEVFIIIHNNTDSIVRFYENWNSYGYYNFTFEIKTEDTTYTISRPHKLWYRNFPSHHSVLPYESIVFPFDLIDTTCASSRLDHGIFEDGWIGFPNIIDTALIRVIYSLPSEYASYPYPDWIARKNDYLGYLDNTNDLYETEPYSPSKDHNIKIYIFSLTIASEWKTVILT